MTFAQTLIDALRCMALDVRAAYDATGNPGFDRTSWMAGYTRACEHAERAINRAAKDRAQELVGSEPPEVIAAANVRPIGQLPRSEA